MKPVESVVVERFGWLSWLAEMVWMKLGCSGGDKRENIICISKRATNKMITFSTIELFEQNGLCNALCVC